MSSSPITVLEGPSTTYHLIGTAHVSKKSIEDVCAAIDELRPDVVCVELCESRYRALTSQSAWADLDIFKVIREGKTLFLLANLAIGAYQRRIGQKLGVKPGAELLAAVEKAQEVGARVELVDRDIHITLKRTWANLRFSDKLGLLSAILGSLVSRRGEELTEEDIESLKDQANLSRILDEFARELPSVREPLIDERDQFLMSGIEQAGGERVVAVVGAAHVPGMKRHFQKPVDREALSRLPPPARWVKALKWLLPALILGLLLRGIFQQQETSLEELLLAWVLPNSLMAGLLTLLAGAKLVSIGTAIIASPITSLIPVLGSGMVVGLVEAWSRKPTVADCERINDDVQNLRGLYRNPVSRVLLVAVAATIGSSLGAFIGATWLITLLT
jgi:pheromone shutdown-related protein TraB